MGHDVLEIDCAEVNIESFIEMWERDNHYMACFHVTPSKLLTALAILKTSEMNQNELTASATGFPTVSKENWSVVAVTAEKNVATVLRFRRLFAACCWANRIVGIPSAGQ